LRTRAGGLPPRTAMSSTFQVIANPNASGGRAEKLLPGLRDALDARSVAYRFDVTERPGHAIQLMEEGLADGVRGLLAVGGDGTLHEIVTGLVRRHGSEGLPGLAVLPVGTGNDFHRMVRSDGSMEGAIRDLLEGQVRRFDVGRVRWPGGERVFVNLFGVGLDVAVLERRHTFRRLPGLLQYLAALAVSVVRFRPLALDVSADLPGGEVFRRRVRSLLAAVTVGPSVAGGIRLSPAACPDDGALDLFVTDGLGLGGVIRHLPRVLRGTHKGLKGVHMHRVVRARLSPSNDVPLRFELDGELMPQEVPWLEVEVIPGVLPILEAP